MGCSSLAAAIQGEERDVAFATERKWGDGVLDRVAATSQAVQQVRARRHMKRERGDSKPQSALAPDEDGGADGDWWSGENGATVAAPADETPFQLPENEDYRSSDEEWDEYPIEDYDYGDHYEAEDYGNEKSDDNGTVFTSASSTQPLAYRSSGGSTLELPAASSGVPVTSKRKVKKKTASTSSANSSMSLGDDKDVKSTTRGSSRGSSRSRQPKTKAKASPKINEPFLPKSNEPVAEDGFSSSSSGFEDKGRGKGRGKSKSKGKGKGASTASSTQDSGEQARQAAAIKIQALQRGRQARKSYKAMASAIRASTAMGNAVPKAKGRQKGKGKGMTVLDSSSDSDAAPAKTAPPRPKGKPKTKPKGGPRTVGGGPMRKSSSMAESSSEDDRRVKF